MTLSLYLFLYLLIADTGRGSKGEESKRVAITHVDCSSMSICEADVVLSKTLKPETDYHLSLEVKDTKGETTIVESHLQSTVPSGAFQG